MKMGMQLKAKAVLFSDTRAPVENWDQEGRLVGSKAVTVIAEAEGTFLEMFKSLSARVSAMEGREATAWEPRLHNVVAQILLLAGGKQEFRTTNCDYFSKMVAANDSGLRQVAKDMEMDFAEVGEAADAVVTRRHALVHPGSLQSLDDEVDKVRSCITPALERLCPQECRFLRAYEIIKQAFPECFK